MKYELIIFDCDGTLLDSEIVYNQCAIDMFAERGFPRYDLDYTFANWMGKALDDIIPFEVAKNDKPLDVQEFITDFISKTPAYMKRHLKEISGAREAVQELYKDFKCCVASNGEMPNILESLKLAGYGEIFEPSHVFSKDQVDRAKPAPDLFLFACDKMQVRPERTIVVEDSMAGIKAGKAAGLYTIAFTGVSHDTDVARKAKEAGADIVFTDWRDISFHINSKI